MKVLCGDIETDSLLDDLTKMHCAVFYDPKLEQEYIFTNLKELETFLEVKKEYKLVIHNGIGFDKPALEKLGISIPNEVLDTLGLSYYLHLKNQRHGLQFWGEKLGIAKPEIDDWENLTLDQYIHRCSEDVKIQTALWDKFWTRLLEIYGTEKEAMKLVRYINWKLQQQRIQENNKIRFDVDGATKLLSKLEGLRDAKKEELEGVMPKVPVIAVKNKPKVMFKMNGEPSANNIKWFAFLDEQGIGKSEQDKLDAWEYIKEYKEPNSGSHQQVKEWLTKLGWSPETFKFNKKDKDPEVLEAEKAAEKKKPYKYRKWIKPYEEKKIPQILTEEKEICPSITRLAKKVPEVRALEGLGVINHRIGLVRGLLEAAKGRGGYVQGRMGGFTNTLRLKHREICNVPSGRKEWGKEIRGLFLADEGGILLGSDLSSLEDRVKHHLQWPIDPDYVKSQMSEDFDPHLLMCETAGLLTPEQVLAHKAKEQDFGDIRHKGKGANYACQYNAGVPTLVRQIGIEKDVAEALHKAYWNLNYSIKVIAESTEVKKDSSGQKWQRNPINGFWYHLKKEADRFSTLVQGTGAYICDMWIYYQNQICLDRFGKEIPLAATFHDEEVLKLNDTEKAKSTMEGIAKEGIAVLNSKLKLNRDMDIDVQFGKNYSEIH